MSAPSDEIVISGVGVVSPLGLSCQSHWSALLEQRSGIGPITTFDPTGLPVRIAGEAQGFDPLQHVKPRKSIKVMARDAQIAVTMAALARSDSGLDASAVNPDRFGVVLGADTINVVAEETSAAYRNCLAEGKFEFGRWGSNGMNHLFPLGMLKLLPNMLASHISISQDARGPNNTIYTSEVSSLLAIGEAASVIHRGQADLMLAGGASSRMQPLDWVHSCLCMEVSQRNDDPQRACRPFDAQRDGQVRGEGGAALILERRPHAESRGAKIYARLVGWSSGCDPRPSVAADRGLGLKRAIESALRNAGIGPDDLAHVNAHGLSTRQDDLIEAQVLAELLPGVPVTAPKSYFGNLFAASGVVEAIVSLLALEHGLTPPTLNYEHPDPACPVAVVHGEPQPSDKRYALVINRTPLGQAAALVVGKC